MTFNDRPRGTQTREKHRILDLYLKAWGGIILNGVAANAKRRGISPASSDVHFVYVDCFAASGRHPSGPGDPPEDPEGKVVYGSPVIGLRALNSLTETAEERGIRLRTNAILIEKNPAAFRELQTTLQQVNLGWHPRVTSDFNSLQHRQVALVQGDSTGMASLLNAYTAGQYTRSLFFLDPFGPKGLPLSFVQEVISKARHDTIINMPYQDLHKKAKSLLNLDQNGVPEPTLVNYDLMFGHSEWRAIAARLQANPYWNRGTPVDVTNPQAVEAMELEVALVQMYRSTLQKADPELAIKSLPLRFADRERTMFHLYLMTHDGTGALTMNGVLGNARVHENEIRHQLWVARKVEKREVQAQMLDMFRGMEDLAQAPPPLDIVPDKADAEDDIRRDFKGRTLTKGKLYKEMADSPYTANQVDAALKALKRQNLVDFDPALTNATRLRFAGEELQEPKR